jgi:hypothetical protein
MAGAIDNGFAAEDRELRKQERWGRNRQATVDAFLDPVFNALSAALQLVVELFRREMVLLC